MALILSVQRAVLEVLAQYHGEELKAINAPRVRKVKPAPSAEHLMQRCRIVLREVAKADSKQTFCSLNGGAMASKSNKVPLAVARPLDFRTIDARLAAGAYGGSTDAFAADMRQVLPILPVFCFPTCWSTSSTIYFVTHNQV